MSFRLFIYYCALCGGWAALVGWIFGKLTAPDAEVNPIGQAGIMGLFLGLMTALGLSLVDAMWNLGFRQPGKVFSRVSVALLVGAVAGLIGGIVGQALLQATQLQLFFVIGWTLTGLLIGASIGVFEILSGLVRQRDVSGAAKKLVECLIVRTACGVLGGIWAMLLKMGWENAFSGKDPNALWSPTAMGFVALGTCIGLLVGLAQVILKEAWIKVEAGFRSGREM